MFHEMMAKSNKHTTNRRAECRRGRGKEGDETHITHSQNIWHYEGGRNGLEKQQIVATVTNSKPRKGKQLQTVEDAKAETRTRQANRKGKHSSHQVEFANTTSASDPAETEGATIRKGMK